ncbi:hypothetical protein JCM19314_3085 [Nonlabens ulvanivorans]|uniref:DUF3109 domain-containing protein n=1 Tax=Nonlabens ulvanivorans TaxID=906888 RepID=A0A090Q7L1_NONUL|nr:DUF3109 family protein [Nonlabens ulvanivorans]GAK99054.1 hypothetical protein JCM19314_3085 [Nonlabens ulvanivorans]
MFQLGKTIVSDDVLEKDFVCNLTACKGVCCVAGEAGAPLEQKELDVLDKEYEKVKPYLRSEGIEAIEAQGTWIERDNGELETPLVNGGAECAYTTFKEDGTALCGIEAAYRDGGATSFYKPISCHLYPVRIQEYTDFKAVNYHKWQICDDACTLGEELGVPVYKFLKEALVRKFGIAWYEELEEIAQNFS